MNKLSLITVTAFTACLNGMHFNIKCSIIVIDICFKLMHATSRALFYVRHY